MQRSDRNQRKERNHRNQPRNGSNQQRQSQPRQLSRQRQERRSGPRQIQLNDFIPTKLRNRSSFVLNLPEEFYVSKSTTNTNNVPVDALPQRAIFPRTIVDSTEPFNVVDDGVREQKIDNGRNKKRQTRKTTTASFRRQQRRI
ncbi:unnamed protein product [Rotaria magnacalcarata]|uniref:Uncharacterized protein n=1 Tax=Rotaria magnacalcarata TaxID=392030 RepID=A0A814KUY2_9BILA|nr:unnamed protein product [Rotaria magnacalcarata]CAF5105538.1 unnamed protein product [Rotaria magnacalcarata]